MAWGRALISPTEVNMDKPKIEYDQKKKELIVDKDTNDGVAKILLAAGKVNFFGQEVKVKAK